MERTLIKTADGSHSLYVEDLDEHYHSIHGAIQESIHVFINTGLKFIASQTTQINILEIGLGTGLNALLTYIEAEKLNLKINYTSLEAFPLSIDLVKELNYLNLLNEPGHASPPTGGSASVFHQFHTCEWNKEISFSKKFTFKKIHNTLQAVEFKDQFQLIYFDAFGPRVQPEMWTEELFSKIYEATKPQGCLVTYCAKGEVKRTLKKVGYTVETLPGPPRKREMVRGTK
jgi:tRNA U34 5-methylaminomethyl-2-thiouridine-forming methyltransferase MnmC